MEQWQPRLENRTATKPMLVLDAVLDKERVGGSGHGTRGCPKMGPTVSSSDGKRPNGFTYPRRDKDTQVLTCPIDVHGAASRHVAGADG